MDTSSICRTSNVIMLKGVKFNNKSGKKLVFEKLDFSSDNIIYCNPGGLSPWLNRGKTGGTDDISWRTNDNVWYRGWIAYDHEIDLQTLYNNGAKYIYCLGSFYLNRVSSTYNIAHSSVCCFSEGGGVYQSLNIYFGNFPVEPIISKIAVDEGVALRGNFNSYIGEFILDIETLIEKGANVIYCGCIHESVPNTEQVISQYPNTVIDKPIVYVVCEQT